MPAKMAPASPNLLLDYTRLTTVGVHRLMRATVLVILWVMGVSASAQQVAITLTSNPSIAAADSPMPVLITAQVLDRSGKAVPDGTIVVFDTTLGEFRESAAQSVNGIAQVFLLTRGAIGTARVTARVDGFVGVGEIEVDFVADQSMLSSAKEYIEVVSPKYLLYSPEQRILHAAAPNRGVTLRYRDIEIQADDLEFNVPLYEVKARNARLIYGKNDRIFTELQFKLNRRRGVGYTTMEVTTRQFAPALNYFRLKPVTKERLTLAEVNANGVSQAGELQDPRFFAFADLSRSIMHVGARKVTAFPSREIQFHRAGLYIDGSRVMTLPLFQMNAMTSTPVITDQFFNVTNNQIAVDYPHYLSLRPGETSLVRIRTGTRYGTGFGVTDGIFMDYELRWNRGDEMDGGFTIRGLTRSDWGLGARHYMRLGDRTSLILQADAPEHSSIFGTASLSHYLDNYQLSLSGSGGRSIRGAHFQNEQFVAAIDRMPMPVGDSPIRMSYGLTASANHFQSETSSRSQQSIGARTQFRLVPQQLDNRTTISSSLGFSKLFGKNVAAGLSTTGNITMSHRGPGNSTFLLTYDYLDDPFNSEFLGRHKIGFQSYWRSGRTNFTFYGYRGLDLQRLYARANISYRFSRDWRITTSYLHDRYLNNVFEEGVFILGYRIGWRELGISFSTRTKRFGIELLGFSLD
ncbi:MAG: hypothetical protein HONBIEJF_00730 [Fimbriimonadaceae bacterium]|nr:hypothetical protein [Fimbriimonadaceae bacterium]